MTNMTSKQRYLAAVRGEPHDRVPVTPIFMQWGAERIGRTYRDFYLDYEVMVAANRHLVEELNIDQVSTISDPWREASGYGMTFDWPDDHVGKPHAYLLQNPADVKKIGRLDLNAPRVKDRTDAVAKLHKEFGATHSVLGWVEGPIAEYSDLRGVEATMMDFIDAPEAIHEAAEKLVDNALAWAKAQIDVGAETIGVGDAAASLMGPKLYREFALPWEKKLIRGIQAMGAIVKLHICGNITGILDQIAETGADIVDIDWMVDLATAREVLGPQTTLAGNFDPSAVLLQGSPETVADAARANIAAAGQRFLLQPGCEVPPNTPIANLRAFCPVKDCLIQDALRR